MNNGRAGSQHQEIDDAIRERRIRVRNLPEALGVSPERVYERWESFRQEVYRRIAEGKSTPEIVAEVGLPTATIAAFRAQFTRGHGPEDTTNPGDLDISGLQRSHDVPLADHGHQSLGHRDADVPTLPPLLQV
jgi:hypothetical protein